MGSACGAVSAAGAVRRRLSTELLRLDSYRAMASKPLRGVLYAGASGSSCGCCIGAVGRREGALSSLGTGRKAFFRLAADFLRLHAAEGALLRGLRLVFQIGLGQAAGTIA